ncbi:MAG: hypothetical protein C5B51_23900 [Terriglobia bacterium]|nr:MAG: hypothetical protein C5B51_23900 [Terriglobia bacterium]
MESDLRRLFDQWHQRVTLNQLAHYEAAKHSRRVHAWLGMAGVIIPSIVGTALFASIESLGKWTLLALGMLCLLAAVLSALNTFLRLATVAELHGAAARQYGSVRRQIEVALAASDDTQLTDLAERVSRWLSELAQDDPPVSPRIWRQVEMQRTLRDTEDLRQMMTKEESIVSALRAYGDLPIGFVTKLAGTTQTETLEIIERLREQRLLEVRGGTVSLIRNGGGNA